MIFSFKNTVLSLGIITTLPMHGVTIIGIAGGTASGKTTLARELQQRFSQHVTSTAQAHYYHDKSHLSPEEIRAINYDHPDALDFKLLKEHLVALKRGDSIVRRSYDFKTTKSIPGETAHPSDIIIVDGILVLAMPEIRKLFDVKVFVNAADDTRLARRIKRDQEQYSWTQEQILTQWQTTVKPMHDEFVQPSKQHADIVIENHHRNQRGIEVLSAVVAHKINRRSHL